MVAVPPLGGAVFRLLIGTLAERVGIKRTGLATMGLTLVPLLWGGWPAAPTPRCSASALLLGVAGASFAVALPLAGYWYPPEYQGLALGIAGAGNSGTIIAALAAPRIAEHVGWHGTFGLAAIPVAWRGWPSPSWPRSRPGRRPPTAAGRLMSASSALLQSPTPAGCAAFYLVTFGGFVGLASTCRSSSSTASAWPRSPPPATPPCARPPGRSSARWAAALADRFGGTRVLRPSWPRWPASASAWPPCPASALTVALLFLAIGCLRRRQRRRVPAGAASASPPGSASITGLVGAAGGVGGFLLPFALGSLGGHHRQLHRRLRRAWPSPSAGASLCVNRRRAGVAPADWPTWARWRHERLRDSAGARSSSSATAWWATSCSRSSSSGAPPPSGTSSPSARRAAWPTTGSGSARSSRARRPRSSPWCRPASSSAAGLTVHVGDAVASIDTRGGARSRRRNGHTDRLRRPGAGHRLVPVRPPAARQRRPRLLRLPHPRRPGGHPGRRRRLPGGRGGRRRAARPGGGQRPAQPGPRDPRGRVRRPAHARAGRRRRRRPPCAGASRTWACDPHRDGAPRRSCAGRTGPGARACASPATDDADLTVDMVVFSAGIRPRDELAQAAGLAVGERGGVVVDEACRTATPASSPSASAPWPPTAAARRRIYGLVAPGYQMARVVADRILGGDATFRAPTCPPSSSSWASTWPASATPSPPRPGAESDHLHRPGGQRLQAPGGARPTASSGARSSAACWWATPRCTRPSCRWSGATCPRPSTPRSSIFPARSGVGPPSPWASAAWPTPP